MRKPWDSSWELLDKIGSGGQGTVKKVKNRSSGSFGAIKILNSQKDINRRSRMYREINTLISLEVKDITIPKIIDHNLIDWRDIETPLYGVFELIEGNTLEGLVKSRGPLELNDALSIFEKIVECVSELHSVNVIHRDIKPDNIIIKDDKLSNPYLIDFGLTFNQEINTEMETKMEEQLGNRFLALPELLTPNENKELKRQKISDITQLSGILFYLLTGVQPMTLLDANGKMPHQRNNIQIANTTRMKILERFFNAAFTYESEYRIQNCKDLNAWINLMKNPDQDRASNLETALNDFRKKVSDSSLKKQRLKEEMCDNILKSCINTFKSHVECQTSGTFVANPSGIYQGNFGNIPGMFHYGVNIHEPRDYIKNTRIHFIGNWSEDTLSVSIELNGTIIATESSELGSVAILETIIPQVYNVVLTAAINDFNNRIVI